MLIRDIRPEEKEIFNRVVDHPLQSYQWGEFKQKTGHTVERLGFFEGDQLQKGLQVSYHKLPILGLNKTVGYLPKGFMPDEDQLSAIHQLNDKNQALFTKLEPNVVQSVGNPLAHQKITQFLLKNGVQPGRPLFTKYTFYLDLTQPEDILFAQLKNKTRYNINLAYKNGVKIFENTTKEGMEQYLEILKETTTRQGFYAHNPQYFRDMWTQLETSKMLKIFNAVYQEKILVSWIIFIFNNVIYYPFGASLNIHREIMASNLMMWEIIRFGKENGCHTFDMWGSLGPNPSKKHPWFGFHRFKKGYGGQLMEFVGTFDLVANQPLYNFFSIAENIRWKWLKLKTHLPF